MMKNDAAKVLTSFIENTHPDRGWQCMTPMPGKEDQQIYFQSAFSLISTIFGLHVNAMIMCLIEIGCLRRLRGHAQASNNGFESFRELVNKRCTFEKSVTSIEGYRNMHFLKLGNIDKLPIGIWKEHKNKSNNDNRSSSLSSR